MMKGNTAAKRRKGGALILIIFTLDFLDNNLPSLQKPVGFPADRLFCCLRKVLNDNEPGSKRSGVKFPVGMADHSTSPQQ
ncbi:hypothetical protein [Dialister succinatiphilus]|uniref:hypothetical protein n=1 Tax=Dialister succinatiphilus TaxID=487173 RepID=UPI004027597F